ncbi:MAG: translation initiation factor IF-1 [Candidatus Paceibacterota bacterium]
MKNKEKIKEEGVVLEIYKNALFKVRLEKSQREVLAHLGGKLRIHFIKILPGDRVVVELSPYDPNRGRIIFRL